MNMNMIEEQQRKPLVWMMMGPWDRYDTIFVTLFGLWFLAVFILSLL